jgi:hypothetical protein
MYYACIYLHICIYTIYTYGYVVYVEYSSFGLFALYCLPIYGFCNSQ